MAIYSIGLQFDELLDHELIVLFVTLIPFQWFELPDWFVLNIGKVKLKTRIIGMNHFSRQNWKVLKFGNQILNQ